MRQISPKFMPGRLDVFEESTAPAKVDPARARLLHSLTLTNRFRLRTLKDLPLFKEAGLEPYGSWWVVGPDTFQWILKERGWA